METNNNLSQEIAFEEIIKPLTRTEQAMERVKFKKMEFENMWKFSEYARELTRNIESRRDKSHLASEEELDEIMKGLRM